MTTAAVDKKRARRPHPDFNQRPDSRIVWLDELVKDAKHPDRISLLPFGAATLWRTIAEGTFPKPVRKRGWLVGDVREWMRAWNALELPPTDSGQAKARVLFSPAPLGTRGTSIGSVRRLPRPGATPLAAPVHAGCQVALAQVKPCPPTDSAQTASRIDTVVGDPNDVRLLLRSIFDGVAA